MTKLENNPHYQNGLFWGRKLSKMVERTTYKTIDNAIFRKKELIEDLKKNFGWNEKNKEISENLGIIKALEDYLIEQKENLIKKGVSSEKINRIANNMGIKIKNSEIEEIQNYFPEFIKNNNLMKEEEIIETIILNSELYKK